MSWRRSGASEHCGTPLTRTHAPKRHSLASATHTDVSAPLHGVTRTLPAAGVPIHSPCTHVSLSVFITPSLQLVPSGGPLKVLSAQSNVLSEYKMHTQSRHCGGVPHSAVELGQRCESGGKILSSPTHSPLKQCDISVSGSSSSHVVLSN